MARGFLLAAALVCGCVSAHGRSDDGGGGEPAPADMAAAPADLLPTGPPDLVPPPKNGCNGLALCIDGCSNDACIMMCQAAATANAVMLHDGATQCAESWCLAGPHDMGVGRCVLDANMLPVDPPGTPAGTCDNCLNDAIAMLSSSKSCVTPGGPDCNPSACVSAQMACLADKP